MRFIVTDQLAHLRERLLPVLQRRHIEKAVVFGSFARGEVSRHSDVDLILAQRTDRRFLDRYDGLLSELSRAVPDRDMDVFIYTPEELASMSQRAFIAAALSEGKVIYESE